MTPSPFYLGQVSQPTKQRTPRVAGSNPAGVIFSPFLLIFLHPSLRRQLGMESDPLWLYLQGSCGLMDKALVFGTKDCRFESCQDQVLLCSIHWHVLIPWCFCSPRPHPAPARPASPSLAWPRQASPDPQTSPRLALPLIRNFAPRCNGKYTWPGSNWRPSACEADVIATRPQVLLPHTGKAHGSACHKTEPLLVHVHDVTLGKCWAKNLQPMLEMMCIQVCPNESIHNFIRPQPWTHWGLSPGPSACGADVIPLHHVPLTTTCSSSRTIFECKVPMKPLMALIFCFIIFFCVLGKKTESGPAGGTCGGLSEIQVKKHLKCTVIDINFSLHTWPA